ncbi:MAG: dihydrofolate reductase, partial [Tepidimonas sp.]|uniref:dihydrofolate reductase n=1 Tax=Tepidimonas sp. TaxID=2002775 RepID=UPI004055083A
LAHCRGLTGADGRPPTEVWVIGGAQVYAQAEPLAQRAVVTEIERAFDGDAHAPALGADWRETAREAHVSADGLPYAFVIYERT